MELWNHTKVVTPYFFMCRVEPKQKTFKQFDIKPNTGLDR